MTKNGCVSDRGSLYKEGLGNWPYKYTHCPDLSLKSALSGERPVHQTPYVAFSVVYLKYASAYILGSQRLLDCGKQYDVIAGNITNRRPCGS